MLGVAGIHQKAEQILPAFNRCKMKGWLGNITDSRDTFSSPDIPESGEVENVRQRCSTGVCWHAYLCGVHCACFTCWGVLLGICSSGIPIGGLCFSGAGYPQDSSFRYSVFLWEARHRHEPKG